MRGGEIRWHATPRFNEMFGFTGEEIRPILDFLGGDDCAEELRAYYDGYRFSPKASRRLYNSDMVLYYATEFDRTTRSVDNKVDPNVVSDYRKIRAVLSIGDRDLEENVLAQIVEEQRVIVNSLADVFVLTQDTEFLFDARTLLSLLFYMGYLTISDSDGLSIELAMPNLVLDASPLSNTNAPGQQF